MFKISTLSQVFVFIFFSLIATHLVLAKDIVKDGSLIVTDIELENAIKYWPEQTRQGAIEDKGVRQSILSEFVRSKKISELMNQITEKSDQEFYWQQQFAIRNLQNKLYVKHYKERLSIPNMEALAKEAFLVSRDKYALIPEKRKASHILIKCLPGKCDREEKKPIAENVLSELKAGSRFEDLVEKYSDDPGSKARKGKLKGWIKRGQPNMNPYFVEGVYTIQNKGGYSDIVETKFGFHIIRIDEVEEKSYKKEAEVLPEIIETLEKKYRNMSLAAHMRDLSNSKDVEIDMESVSELLKPYSKKAN